MLSFRDLQAGTAYRIVAESDDDRRELRTGLCRAGGRRIVRGRAGVALDDLRCVGIGGRRRIADPRELGAAHEDRAGYDERAR